MDTIKVYNLHQPTFLNPVSIFDLQNQTRFLNEEKALRHYNKKVRLLTKFLDQINTNKKYHILLGGKILKKLQHNKDVCKTLKRLTKKEVITPLSETTHRSISHLFSKEEFKTQLKEHQNLCKKVFGKKPKTYVDTTKSFNKETSTTLKQLNFTFVISNNIATEGKIFGINAYKLNNNIINIKQNTPIKPQKPLKEFTKNHVAQLNTQKTILNQMQEKALEELKAFETYVKQGKKDEILNIWQALTCYHVFQTMCNNTNNTHHEHPHNNAYEVHMSVMNILNGLAQILNNTEGQPLKRPKVYNSPSALLS